MNRHELTAHLRTMPYDQNSNLKFYNILKSRLTEHDIPLKDATVIAKAVDFDFSNVPEDNDSLSEFATELAEWCAKGYKQAVVVNNVKNVEEIVRFLVPNFKLGITNL